jgi:hypothetical protein
MVMLGEGAGEVHQRLVDTMGNLTLTGYNSELSNAAFDEKKKRLEDTHIELNRWILHQPSWRAEQIDNRAQDLFVRAISLWPGPSQHLG